MDVLLEGTAPIPIKLNGINKTVQGDRMGEQHETVVH